MLRTTEVLGATRAWECEGLIERSKKMPLCGFAIALITDRQQLTVTLTDNRKKHFVSLVFVRIGVPP